MHRKLFVLLSFFLISFQLPAYSGMLAGEKDLRVAKSKWFDIIYPARCEESAAILYEKADVVYEEVTAQYGLTPYFRMPVVITPAVEEFNAFWTSVPYNHIAIFDTGSSGADDLAVFSETLLSTFRHELTHAVTYNMKDGFWRVMGNVFGDCVVPGMLTVTTGMAEGATVTSESMAGEGRLNDEFAKHYVKQAKIEDAFPSYHDVSGAADNQPGGAPYYFNGAFHNWLQEKYGLEAYANFWFRVVNGKDFTISGSFKKAYGIKLKEAWKQFVEDYEVPKVAANPVSAGLVQDFFEPENTDYSRLNDAGSLYSSLASAAGRLVWLDRVGGRVFTAGSETSSNGVPAPDGPSFHKLFSHRNMYNVRLSNDGRFLTINYVSENSANDTARVKIYDLERGRFYSVRETGLKDSVIVKSGGGWYLVAQKYMAQHYSVAVFQLVMSGASCRVTSVEPYAEIVLGVETNPYAFTALEDGTFAYLKKTRLSYSLCISSVDGTLINEYAFPEGMVVRSLSYGPEGFYFSYAQKGTLPRLGILKTGAKGALLVLNTQDISGGVFEPVYWNNKIVYVGEFFRQNRLLCMDAGAGGDDSAGAEAAYEPLNVDTSLQISTTHQVLEASTPSADSTTISIPSKKYNPLPYLTQGIIIPISDYATDTFLSEPKVEIDSDMALFNNFIPGISYITANPWANGSSDLFQITGGYNFATNTFGTAASLTKGTSTPLLISQTKITSEFNKNGWKQGALGFGLSSTIEAGRMSNLFFSNSTLALLNSEQLFNISDVISAQFSSIKKTGPGRFEKGGFAVSVSYGIWYEAEITKLSEERGDISEIAAAAKICIPRLLPLKSKYGFTYNLPASLTFSLLPVSSIYGYTSFGTTEYDENTTIEELNRQRNAIEDDLGRVIFDAAAETNLFSMDIQKAIPGFTAVYLNDFFVTGGYAATGTAGSASKGGFQTQYLGDYFKAMTDGTGYYLDSVYAKVQLDFTPNVGVFAKPAFKTGIYAVYSYTLHGYKALKPLERLKVSVGADINF